ncbi:hypothetical protein SPHINGOAX6_71195 [Sphingomonas sp. AX6]|nr:hypothetical protein SPHINGOAX6_71195 [Sphingomonas sp. AX6]
MAHDDDDAVRVAAFLEAQHVDDVDAVGRARTLERARQVRNLDAVAARRADPFKFVRGPTAGGTDAAGGVIGIGQRVSCAETNELFDRGSEGGGINLVLGVCWRGEEEGEGGEGEEMLHGRGCWRAGARLARGCDTPLAVCVE